MAQKLPAHADTVVIGGGVIGTSCAYWLDRAGHAVTLIERRPALGTLTTPNALGTIRTQFGTPALVDLAKESLEFYRDLEARLGVSADELGWANQGYLYLTDNPDHVDKLYESLSFYQNLGVPSSEVIEQPTLGTRFPFVGRSVAGIFHGDGAWVDPARIAGAWARATPGASFITDTEVLDYSRLDDGRWKIETSLDDMTADHVVICSGPYGPAALRRFGVDLPIKITPRYKAFIPDDEPDHAAAPLVINIANGAYWRPVTGGVWLSTANVDDRSVEPAEQVEVPPGFLELCIEEIEPVSPRLAASARAMDPDAITITGGFQTYPADDVPIIDEVPEAGNLFVNCGHWAGVMLSPASGRLLADIVDRRIPADANPCRIARFADGPVERSSTNKFGGWG
ncbi:MAG: NAD(P)/FAD-dependent oxidoreductase [Acidimicrobiales bacterium]